MTQPTSGRWCPAPSWAALLLRVLLGLASKPGRCPDQGKLPGHAEAMANFSVTPRPRPHLQAPPGHESDVMLASACPKVPRWRERDRDLPAQHAVTPRPGTNSQARGGQDRIFRHSRDMEATRYWLPRAQKFPSGENVTETSRHNIQSLPGQGQNSRHSQTTLNFPGTRRPGPHTQSHGGQGCALRAAQQWYVSVGASKCMSKPSGKRIPNADASPNTLRARASRGRSEPLRI